MPPPIRFARVARVSDVPAGTMKTVSVDGRDVLVLNVEGQVYALDNQCPHQGGPLGRGRLEERTVICPWHGWRWDVKSGRAIWPDGGWRAACYPVAIQDGEILVRVP